MHNKLPRLGALTVGLLIITACADDGDDGDSDASTTLRLGHTYATDSLEHRTAERFAENLDEASDGEITVDIYPAAQLGSWEEMQESLEVGSVDIVIESVGSLERYTDLAAIEGVPFIYEDEEHFFQVWDAGLGEEILEELREDAGFHLTGHIYRGPRVLNTSTPVEDLDDLAGVSLRVPNQETYINAWQALGASPTPMSFDEIYSGIEQGAIDGQENPVNVARFDSFYEVAPYIAHTNHLYGNNYFQLWGDTYDSWDDEMRTMFDEAIEEASEWSRDVALDEEEENIQYLEDNGVTFSDIDHQEWAEATEEVIDNVDPQVQEWAEEIQER